MVKTTRLTADQAWDRLLDAGVSEESLRLVSSILGHSIETYEQVLYAHTGYRTFAQLEGEDQE